MDQVPNQSQRIRRTLRDLEALSALPAIGAGRHPRRIAEGLTEVLFHALGLDFVYLRLERPIDGENLELACTGSGPGVDGAAYEIGGALAPWLGRHDVPLPESIPNPVGVDTVRLILLPIGYDEADGVLVAASKRSAFPTEEDRLLLSVAASQTGIVLQRYWIEEAGRRANERLELAVRGSNIGIWELEIQGDDVRKSPVNFTNVWEQLGYDRALGPIDFATAISLVHPDDTQRLEAAIRSCIDNPEKTLEVEFRARKKIGSYRWMLTRGVVVCDEQSRPLRLVGSAIDITEHKRAEDALRRNEVRLAEAQIVAHIGSWDWNIRNDTVRWSDEHYRIFGLRPQSVRMTYDRFLQLVHPDDQELARTTVNEALRSLQPFDYSLRTILPGGQLRVLQSRGRVSCDSNGAPIRMYGTVQDITELKQTEERLRQSEERFRGTFENAAVGIVHTDAEGRFLRVNERFCEIVGYPREELLAKSIREITHPDDVEFGMAQLGALMRDTTSSYSTEKRYVRKDGAVVWGDLTVSLQRDVHGRPAYAIKVLQDVSDRKSTEESLRIANERLDLAMRGSNIGMWEVDLTDDFNQRARVRHFNFWEHLGYGPEEFPAGVSAALDMGHPDDRQRTERAVIDYLAGETSELDIENRPGTRMAPTVGCIPAAWPCATIWENPSV